MKGHHPRPPKGAQPSRGESSSSGAQRAKLSPHPAASQSPGLLGRPHWKSACRLPEERGFPAVCSWLGFGLESSAGVHNLPLPSDSRNWIVGPVWEAGPGETKLQHFSET